MNVTLTNKEATAVLLLLKSMTYDEMRGEDAMSFQATLCNLGERIEMQFPDSCAEQYAMWQQLKCPSWECRTEREPIVATETL